MPVKVTLNDQPAGLSIWDLPLASPVSQRYGTDPRYQPGFTIGPGGQLQVAAYPSAVAGDWISRNRTLLLLAGGALTLALLMRRR